MKVWASVAMALTELGLGRIAWAEPPKPPKPRASKDTAEARRAANKDPKLACIAAFEEAQVRRNASQFLASQARLLACAKPECGEALLSECTQMYSELDSAIPSVVFSAHDSSTGIDRSDVSVAINGKPTLEVLDGKPISLDPGDYTFTFTAPGTTTVTREVIVRTGEKYRQINVNLQAPEPIAAPAPAASLQPEPRETKGDRGREGPGGGLPTSSYVLGGAGVASLATFGVLRLIGAAEFNSMQKDCAPGCPRADVSNLELEYLVSNVALGVGLAAIAGAVVVGYAIESEEPDAPDLALSVGPRGDGTLLHLCSRF
jgi:hypothetical protein